MASEPVYGKGIIGLFKKSWHEIPSATGATLLGVFGLCLIMYDIYALKKSGEVTNKYKDDYIGYILFILISGLYVRFHKSVVGTPDEPGVVKQELVDLIFVKVVLPAAIPELIVVRPGDPKLQHKASSYPW